MLIRCLDVEATGLPTEEDPQAVCEVGFCDVLYDPDPLPDLKPCTLGTPTAFLTRPGRPIPPQARGVHHISNEMCDRDGIATTTAFIVLMGNNEGGRRPDFFCAHKAEYELNFFKGADIPWLCTWKIALRLWPDAPDFKLQTLRYYLDLQVDEGLAFPPHRAGPDAFVGAALLCRILEDARCDLDAFARWSKGAALLPSIGFGKHKGSKWEDVPTDYLDWIVDKSDLDRDVKANARHHLKLRGKL